MILKNVQKDVLQTIKNPPVELKYSKIVLT